MKPHLLDVSNNGEGRVLLGGQSRGNTESVRHSSIVMTLIPGSSLDHDTDGGDWTVVLKRGHGQSIGQGGHLQRLGLDKLPLCPGNCSLGKLSLGCGLKIKSECQECFITS